MISRDTAHLLTQTRKEASSLAEKLSPHRPGEILVRLEDNAVAADLVDSFDATVLHQFEEPLLHLKLPPGVSTAQAMAAMGKMDSVAYAEPNHTYQLQQQPNDLDERLWGLNNTGQNGGRTDADIDAPEAWAINKGSSDGPIIAVLDTGVDLSHPDLRANLWTNPGEVRDGIDNDGNGIIDDLHGYNALEQSGDPHDGHSHGTHCAGTIGAEGDNGRGIVGINWDAQIMAIKIYDDNGSTDAASIVRGIEYATEHGARITSNSWGGNSLSRSIHDAFAASPALHIAAAGNDRRNNDERPFYPAAYTLDSVVSVAATSRHDELASFSNYGAVSVDLAAPGVTILSTMPGGGYDTKNGTSMAAPHVAGTAGLIASQYPEADNREIKARLLGSVDRVRKLEGRVATEGRLNAARALEADEVAPDSPTDLRASETKPSTVKVTWTATGDDGSVGQAASYDLRMSEQPITNTAAFTAAERVAAPHPEIAGSQELVEVDVVPMGQERQVHFALQVQDNVGNRSEIVQLAATVPAADLPFEDPVNGDASNWSVDGDWAQVEQPGRGWVWTDSPDGPYEMDSETSITTQTIDLTGYSGAKLRFEAKHELEDRHDVVKVQVFKGGWWRPWRTVATLTGESDWKAHTLDLSDFDGKEIQIRFLMEADDSVVKDGFYLDNVVVSANPSE